MNWKLGIGLSLVFFAVGFLILFDQYRTIGAWFQLSDALHHEPLALIAFALGIGVLIGSQYKK